MRFLPRGEVEARSLNDDADWEQIADWCGGTLENSSDQTGEYTTRLYLGPEHDAEVGFEGDWVVKIDDEFHVMEPDDFVKTYVLPTDPSEEVLVAIANVFETQPVGWAKLTYEQQKAWTAFREKGTR